MYSYSWDLAENGVAPSVAEFKKIGKFIFPKMEQYISKQTQRDMVGLSRLQTQFMELGMYFES
jgi:hypothetical protein